MNCYNRCNSGCNRSRSGCGCSNNWDNNWNNCGCSNPFVNCCRCNVCQSVINTTDTL